MDAEQFKWLFGWLSCVICLSFTLRFAFVFAKSHPQTFLALNIYAAQWGVLIVYYASIRDPRNAPNTLKLLPEFLPALSGYLCGIVGSIVYRAHSGKTDIRHRLLRTEKISAYLLLTLALPQVLDTPWKNWSGLHHDDIEVGVTFLLKTFGFYALFRSLRVACDRKALQVVVTVLLIFYELLEAAYTWRWFYLKYVAPQTAMAMNAFFLYGFGAVKLLTAFTYIPAILYCYKEFRELSFVDRVLAFLVHDVEGHRRKKTNV